MKKLALLFSLLASACMMPGYANAIVIENGTILQTNSNGSTIDYWFFSVGTSGLVTIDTLSWETSWDTGPWDPAGVETATDVNGDGEIAFVDTSMILFSDDGTLDAADYIAESHDSGDWYYDPISDSWWITDFDAIIEASLSVGDYILAISSYYLDLDEAVEGIVNNDFDFGVTGPYTCEGDDGELCGNVLEIGAGDYQISWDGDVKVAYVESTSTKVPEPSTLALFALGVLGLGAWRRRR